MTCLLDSGSHFTVNRNVLYFIRKRKGSQLKMMMMQELKMKCFVQSAKKISKQCLFLYDHLLCTIVFEQCLLFHVIVVNHHLCMLIHVVVTITCTH